MIAFSITTDRLVLRPFTLDDAPRVKELAGAWDVASVCGSVPHPYPHGEAERWIGLHDVRRARRTGYPFAVTREGVLVGSFGVEKPADAEPFDLGYWLGTPYWGLGYATEAATAVVAFAFGWLGAERLTAGHIVDNAASARVLAKLGFAYVGSGPRPCRARKGQVPCIDLVLTRDAWAAKKV